MDTHLLLQFLANIRLLEIVLVITLERERVNRVRKVVAVAVFLEVRNELIDVLRRGAEGPARREVNVTDDLIDADNTSDVASFTRLVFQLV